MLVLVLITSVASIQGIANVAAISGANADEASRAMYNFAQALSKGNVQLIDWKSIEMANMATAEFKQQLIDSAVAAGTLTKRGEEYITTTGKAVTSTKGFNDSLTDGWLTTEALNATLSRYSDVTTDIGARATAAAQDIKTFTQMVSTLKETAGSGWAQTFEIMFGNFEEGKHLWTDLGQSIGDFVNKSADSRNKLLQDWKDMGGRGLLIQALKSAVGNLADVLAPIKEAFQDVFPPATAETLMNLTRAFARFAQTLKPTEQTVENVGRIFKGLFSILEIGWEVIKQTIKFFGTLIDAISGASSGSFLAFLAQIGDFFTGLNKMLVEGEGIKNFFEVLGNVIAIPIALIGDLKDKMLEFFGVVGQTDIGGAVDASFGRVQDRFQSLSEIFDKITNLWQPVKEALMKVKDVLSDVAGELSDWFSEFLDTLAGVFKSGDFNKILDALNVGLFGGLLLIMNKFINKGIKINATLQGFFGGGLFEKIGKSFDALTGTLQSMQAKIKAEALMKIAEAIAILTASVLVLSLIDSEALAKALTAMAVGFGQLMAAFSILNKISMGVGSSAKFGVVAVGMNLLATAILILSAALKVLSTMSWSELAIGLGALTGLLTILVVATEPLAKQSLKMVAAGVGLVAIGVALTILAGAVKLFSLMNLTDMAKGFLGISAGLLILAVAMEAMPMSVLLIGPGLVAVAFAMNILAGALKIFATMSWGDIGRGLVVLAGSLIAIGVAMQMMPISLPITAAGLVLVGLALNEIAGAMKIFGTMSWGDIARGLVAMAGALLVLGVAANAMASAIPGAIAIGIVAGSLVVLAAVLKAFALVSWDDLLHGLAGIAAVFAVLGIAALALEPVIPALLGLGVALVLVGGGFALFGLGVSLVAEGLALFIDIGPKAATALEDMLKAMGRSLPAIFTGLAQGVIEFAQTIADAAPILVDAIVTILNKLLDGLETLIPKVIKLLGELISGVIEWISVTGIPQLVEAGLHIILALLQGIRNHIDDVIIVVGEIITNFLDALAEELPKIVDSVANLFVKLLTSVAEAIGKISGSLMFGIGISLITGMMDGMSESLSGIWEWIKEQFNKIIDAIKSVFGIKSPSTVMMQIGVDIITGLLNGIIQAAVAVKDWFSGMGRKVIEWIGDALGMLKDVGSKVIGGFWEGVKSAWTAVGDWFDKLSDLIKYHIPNPLKILWDVGKQIVQGLLEGIQSVWHTVTDWVGGAINGLKSAWTSAKGFFTGSPSRFMIWVGEMIIAGFVKPFDQDTSMESSMGNFVDKSAKIFENSISAITSSLGEITEFQPTITPVLDLTEVKSGAQKIADYMATSDIGVSASYGQAQNIASTPSNVITATTDDTTKTAGVKFEQNIYAPSQLSTSDIYKQTRNQITMAKEELSIP